MKRAVVMVAMVGCGGSSGAAKATMVNPTTLDAVKDTKGDEAIAKLERLRGLLRTDPDLVLTELGATEDEIEPIIRKVFERRIAHKYAKQKPPTVQPEKRDEERRRAEVDARRQYDTEHADDDKRWWCYEVEGVDIGICRETRSSCEQWRANGLARNPPPMGVVVKQCARQQRAGCFRMRLVLQAAEILNCAPSMKLCGETRSFIMKSEAADAKVLSECEPT